MNSGEVKKLVRDALVIILAITVPAALLSTAISDALSSRKPDWLYLAFCGLLVVTAILARTVSMLLRSASDGGDPVVEPVATFVPRHPADRASLGDLVPAATQDLCFFGVSAKRSVTEDSFRRSLEKYGKHPPKLRFLLLDPKSAAFERRARDERESSEVWRVDQEMTVMRLKSYKESLGIDVEVRYSSRYPVWRTIIIDRKKLYVSPFLPGQRGTESTQYEFGIPDSELAVGLLQDFEVSWESARKESRL